MTCDIRSTPNHTQVYWHKVSNELKTNITSETSGIDGATVISPSLTILRTVTSDSGLYTCCAVNAVGIGCSNTTQLTVIGGEFTYKYIICKRRNFNRDMYEWCKYKCVKLRKKTRLII